MTRALGRHPQPRQHAVIGRATIARLLIVLSLVLFGVPQGQSGGLVTQTGPAAETRGEQAKGILTVQRHLMRAQLPHDVDPDTVATGVVLRGVQSGPFVTVKHAPDQALSPFAIRILPPVRGPPAA